MVRIGKGASPKRRKSREVWPRREGESTYDYRRRIADTAIARGNNLSSSPARKPHQGAAKPARAVGREPMQKMRRLTAMGLLHKMVGSYDFVRSSEPKQLIKRRVKTAKRRSMSVSGGTTRPRKT